MLLLAECIGFVSFVQEDCIISNREVGMFSFVGPCRPNIPCNLQDDSTTENTLNITRSFFLVALVCQVVTCAFDTSRFETAIIFGVPIYLTVCTLSHIPFVFGRFKFYFALLHIFYVEYALVIRGRLQFYRKHGEW
jgi:hypothetical protein